MHARSGDVVMVNSRSAVRLPTATDHHLPVVGHRVHFLSKTQSLPQYKKTVRDTQPSEHVHSMEARRLILKEIAQMILAALAGTEN
jgi:hypothetical protein